MNRKYQQRNRNDGSASRGEIKRKQSRISGIEKYSKVKYSIEGLAGRLEQTEKKLMNFENRSVEIMQSEKQKKNEKNLTEFRKPVKYHQQYQYILNRTH